MNGAEKRMNRTQIPGLKCEILGPTQDRLWGTQVRAIPLMTQKTSHEWGTNDVSI